MTRADLLQLYHRLGLTPIPLCTPRPGGGCFQHGSDCRHPGKRPLVRWRNGWNPTAEGLEQWDSQCCNWGIRCGPELAGLDFDTAESFPRFLESHPEANSWPRVKTGRGFHLWVKPVKPVRSQRVNGLEVKCIDTLVVVPPSIHPNGKPYTFEVALDGILPEVNLEELLGLGQIDSSVTLGNYESVQQVAPSDFALHYGKSPYPRSLCGLATKVLTRSDGKVKHLVSMRDWKWDCPKCAPLLKRHWLEKLRGIPFKFILRLPTWDKPTKLLRHLGRPRYAHIVANGESWLFLLDGEAESVWAEAQRAGYSLVCGDAADAPTGEDIEKCLNKALCQESEPLNARRKITHSRELLKRQSETNGHNESKEKGDCGEGKEDMNASRRETQTWHSEVVMKSIEEVAKELEAQGWKILWQSEVEALAVRADATRGEDIDIVELMQNLGVKLKKTGKEYTGVCPLHDDHNPSLSVNRERGLWHCFGCGRSGDVRKFVDEWQTCVKRD